MYDHGLAAIALCECYGMSGAKDVRAAAQAALNFIARRRTPTAAAGATTLASPATLR